MLGVWIDPVTAHEIMTLPVFFAMTASVFSFAGNLQARTRRRHRRDRIGARIDQDDLPIESPGGTPPILSMTRAAAAATPRAIGPSQSAEQVVAGPNTVNVRRIRPPASKTGAVMELRSA